jgi:hypothetical protein
MRQITRMVPRMPPMYMRISIECDEAAFEHG